MNIEYTESIWSLDEEKAVKDLEGLKNGEHCFYPESDYGHGSIYKKENGFECWSIPMYGGDEMFESLEETAESAFNLVCSWT